MTRKGVTVVSIQLCYKNTMTQHLTLIKILFRDPETVFLPSREGFSLKRQSEHCRTDSLPNVLIDTTLDPPSVS